MHQVKVRKYVRRHGLGRVAIIALAAIALNGSCFFDTKNNICANGRLCPLGWTCTDDQDGCTRDGCGDGVMDVSNGEVCDDGNKIDGDDCDSNCTPTGCHNGIQTQNEMCDDGNTNNDDACVDNCVIAKCGDDHIHMEVEDCDDGNAITDVCAYGQTSCLVCDNTCHSANGVISSCGDGNWQPAFENCDDRNNSSCGTCSSDCQTFSLDYAIGKFGEIGSSQIVNGGKFTLNDGINPEVIFEFSNENVLDTIVKIPLNSMRPIGKEIEEAINRSPEPLLIKATWEDSEPPRVNLKHRLPTALGNQGIMSSPSNIGFIIEGMTGGASGDCHDGVGCNSNADCRTNVCLSDKICGCRSNAGCASGYCFSDKTCACRSNADCASNNCDMMAQKCQ